MIDVVSHYIGRQLVYDGVIFTVTARTQDESGFIIKDVEGNSAQISNEELHVLLAQAQSDPTRSRQYFQTKAGQEDQEVRLQILRAEAELNAQGYLSWTQRHALLAEKFQGVRDRLGRPISIPSVRTLQSWKGAFRAGGRQALADARRRSGNRNRRHDPVFEAIIIEQLEERFLNSDRVTIKELHRISYALYRVWAEENHVRMRECGERVVRSILATLPHRDLIKRRIGGDKAAQELLRARHFEMVQAPFERVEIDSTQADIFVVIDDQGNVARPHICAAIDCATGLIVGMSLSLTPPNAELTARTLKEMMVPHGDAFFDAFGIRNRLEAIGRPLVTISDQGSENSGPLIESIVEHCLYEFRKNIPKKPEKKPFIERLFGVMNEFIHSLPGATETRLMKNRTRIEKATAEARLTFEQFEAMLQRWRYDVYAQMPRKRVTSHLRTNESPAASWRRLLKECLVPEPPSESEIRQMFFAGRTERKLQRYGVEYQRIQYFGEAGLLLDQYGPGAKLEIRYDPTDIRMLLARHPNDDDWVELTAKDPDLPAISFAELERLRKSLPVDELEAQGALSAQVILREMTRDMHRPARGQRTKARRAAHAAQDLQRDQQTASRSKTSPRGANSSRQPEVEVISLNEPVFVATPSPPPPIERRRKP